MAGPPSAAEPRRDMRDDAVESGVVEAVVAGIDALAYSAIRSWGDDAEPSQESLQHLQSMYELAAQQDPAQLPGRCPRLRLVALATKVLRHLSRSPSPVLADTARAWAAEATRRWGVAAATPSHNDQAPHADYEDLADSLRVMEGLRVVLLMVQPIDIVPGEGCECIGGQPVDTAVVAEVIAAVQLLNGRALPPPRRPPEDLERDRLPAQGGARLGSSQVVVRDDSPPSSSQRSSSQRSTQPAVSSQSVEDPAPVELEPLSQVVGHRSSACDSGSGSVGDGSGGGRGHAEAAHASFAPVRRRGRVESERATTMPYRVTVGSVELPVSESNAASSTTVGRTQTVCADAADTDIFMTPLLDGPPGAAPGGTQPAEVGPPLRQHRRRNVAAAPGPLVAADAAPEDHLFLGGARLAGRTMWTEEEEQRLLRGYRFYGPQWEQIRRSFALEHRFGTQLREKWRNLQRYR